MAQEELVPGFIITNTNDTVRGTLRDKDWYISPENIKFKANGEPDYKTYSAKDLKAFFIEGRALYLSRAVLLDVSPIDMDKLILIDVRSVDLDKLYNDAYPPDTTTRQIFIKELVKGNISLYYHKDATSKPHFFFRKNDSAFTELISRKYKSKTNRVWLYEKFRRQLEVLMQQCPSLTETIKSVSYNEEELSDLVIAFNNCVHSPAQISSTPNKPARFKVALAAGFFTSDIAFSGTANAYGIKEANFSPYRNFTGGISVIFLLEKRFQRHHIVSEFLWKNLKYNAFTDETIVRFGLPSAFHNEYVIDIGYIKLNVIYRYHFLKKEKTKLFLEVGYTNSLAVDMEATLYQEEKMQSSIYHKQITLFERKHEQGFTIAAGGYYLDKWGIKLLHEKGNGMSDYSYLKSAVSSFYLFVNYILSKRQ